MRPSMVSPATCRVPMNSPAASRWPAIRTATMSSTAPDSQPPSPGKRVISTVANAATVTCQIAPTAIMKKKSARYSVADLIESVMNRQVSIASTALHHDLLVGAAPEPAQYRRQQHHPDDLHQHVPSGAGRLDPADVERDRDVQRG